MAGETDGADPGFDRGRRGPIHAAHLAAATQPIATGPSYINGFAGIARGAFPDAARAVLSEAMPEDVVEIKPDGIPFAPGVYFRNQLNRAFGQGAWAIAQRGPVRQIGNTVCYSGALFVLGQFVSEAMGECFYRDGGRMSFASAAEGAKTDAIGRCCKDLGMAHELFDREWRERWIAKNAVQARDGKWSKRTASNATDQDMAMGAGGAAVDKAMEVFPAAKITSVAAVNPANSADTGEAASDVAKASVRSLVKSMKWKPGWAKSWLLGHFGVGNLDEASARQVENAYHLLSNWDEAERREKILDELVAAGECKRMSARNDLAGTIR